MDWSSGVKHPSHAFAWSYYSSHFLYSNCLQGFFSYLILLLLSRTACSGRLQKLQADFRSAARFLFLWSRCDWKHLILHCLPAHRSLRGFSFKILSLNIYAALTWIVPIPLFSHAPAAVILHSKRGCSWGWQWLSLPSPGCSFQS